MKDKKNLMFFLKILPGIIIGSLFETLQATIFDSTVLPPIVAFIIIAVGITVVFFFIDLITYLVKLIKRKDVKHTLVGMDELGHEFVLSDGSPMFDVNASDIARFEQIFTSQSKFERLVTKANQFVYHSVTAKENLPWVEYVFWSYLRKIKEKYHCKVIVSLHYSEDIRESGLINARDKIRYKELHNKYAAIAKRVIGDDIKVIDEEDFHKKYGKFFAMNYHNIFTKQILKYIHDFIDNGRPLGDADYKQFNRRLSYIESVFPILCMMTKKKRGTMYILDRELAHKVWSEDEWLNEYIHNHGILMLTGQTLRNDKGEALRIFKPGDTIDINGSDDRIREEIKAADVTIKKNLLSLLSVCLNKNAPTDYSDLDIKCLQLCIEARDKLNFTSELMC